MGDMKNFEQNNTNTLSIKIDNNNSPIELESFSKSLTSLNNLYLYCNKLNKSEKLFIKEISKGSIIVNITSIAINTIEHTNTLIQFALYLKALKLFFENNKIESDKIITENNFSKINKPVMESFKSLINIKINSKDISPIINISIHGENISIDTKELSKNIAREIDKLSPKDKGMDR